MRYGYPNLYNSYDWKVGVCRAPIGYEHPWLVVFTTGTVGAWSRREAKDIWREGKYDQESIMLKYTY